MKKTGILSVEKLTKVFGNAKKPFIALDRVSFDLKQGEILGLLGPNGAGKTTTIQMLLSTLKPTSGKIIFFGKDLSSHRSQILKDVSFASTYIRLPHRLTIYENLDVYGRLFGVNLEERQHRIKKFLTFFGVWNQRDKLCSGLSAGQVTRVMLAKAFLAYPKIALLDEPTASLDPDISKEVREFVLTQRREHDVSILFTSHNMDEVSQVCDRVLFLQSGKIVANDTPSNLAKSISVSKVELMISDGFKRTQFYCDQHRLKNIITENVISIEVDEQQIADLLIGLAQAGVSYTQISIDKPTLEDYFIQVASLGSVKRSFEESL